MMGNLTAYALGSALCLALCWLAYRLFLSGKKQPSFNRKVIIAIYLLSLIWLPATGLVERVWPRAYPASPIHIGIDEMMVGLETVGEDLGAPWWATLAVILYTVSLSASALWMLVSLIGIWRIRRKCCRVEGEGYTLLVSQRPGISPFNWGRDIVISEDDYALMDPLVLSHELAHLRHRHWLDLLLAQGMCVFQCFNPAAWLLRSELAMLHEYEADAAVVAEGGDEREYQLLLLNRAAGEALLNPLINNLGTSNLKKRIAMMKKNESGLKARYGALALLPALAVAWMLNGTETFASVSDATSQATVPAPIPVLTSGIENSVRIISDTPRVADDSYASSVKETREDGPVAAPSSPSEEKTVKEVDGQKVYLTPDQIPDYPGGMKALMAWLGEHLRYPASMIEDQVQGRVIVQFVIGKDGKVSNPRVVKGICPAADDEALRVVKEMPAWIPGREGGKPVACQFTLPVSFKLAEEKPSSPTASASSSAKPAYFVEGVLFTGDLSTIDSSTIESMTVDKSDPAYPDGRIDIKLKH